MVAAFTIFLLVSLIAGLVLVAKQLGKSQALLDESEDELAEFDKFMKEKAHAEKNRPATVDDAIIRL